MANSTPQSRLEVIRRKTRKLTFAWDARGVEIKLRTARGLDSQKRSGLAPTKGDHRMSNRGGKRRGAGRPLGSKNRRSAEIARAAAEDGITPIEVMLGAMRDLWEVGTPEAKREASEIAKDAAPYIHPRLASIDQTIKEDRPFALIPSQVSIEEWEVTYGAKALEDKSSDK
jgi:hypothetical protein